MKVYINVCVYIYIFIFIFSSYKSVKTRAISCPHQPPARGDNTVSVAQGGTATPGATKQLLYIYIYMYIYIYCIFLYII